MIQKNPEPLTELDRALVECLRIFARRGRAIREAAEKQTAGQVHFVVGNNPNLKIDTPYSVEKDIEDNSLKDAHMPGAQQPQVSIAPDQYDI